MLEADVGDIVVDTSTTLSVASVPSTGLDWAALAAAASSADGSSISDGTLGSPRSSTSTRARRPSFGAHRRRRGRQDTGKVTLLRHLSRRLRHVLNPLLVEGQQHGGVAAGVSQTLYGRWSRRRWQP
jgi:hypothetical protein